MAHFSLHLLCLVSEREAIMISVFQLLWSLFWIHVYY